MQTKISAVISQAQAAFQSIKSLAEVLDFEKNFLGKKSELSGLSKSLKDLVPEEKQAAGKAVSDARKTLENLIASKKSEFAAAELAVRLEQEWIDVTKKFPRKKGAMHPISLLQKEIEDVCHSMGFSIADGPQIETEWHNFDALNIPGTHPARDMQDTFWLQNDGPDKDSLSASSGQAAEISLDQPGYDKLKNTPDGTKANYVLRTQTSNVQIRTMQKYGAPCRVIAPGRVFRNEDVDATHDAVFYQFEGLLVDRGISLAHLKGTLTELLSKLFAKEMKIRLRPGYFPFVEPGFEVDVWWEYTDKNGTEQGKWLELLGAGMVHPNVLRNCGVDPEEFSGFAFGVGLTRLAMMKYGINDIRLLLSQKIDFLSQF